MSHGRWIETFRRCGFEVEELIEVRRPEGATTSFEWMSGEWARQWPAEGVWKVCKRT
jgi:hypothetical protein